MMKTVREIDWDKFDEALPAFLTMIGIPLTYDISSGIGFITYVAVKTARRKFGEIHPLLYLVSLASFILSPK